MTNFVINIKLNHENKELLTTALNTLDKVLLSCVSKNDFCRYYGIQYQLRAKKSSLKKIFKIIEDTIKMYQLDYWIVIADGLEQSKYPINLSYCDALVESGTLFDKLIASRTKNMLIEYSFINKKQSKFHNDFKFIKLL